MRLPDQRSRPFCFARGEVRTEDGTLVATGTGTFKHLQLAGFDEHVVEHVSIAQHVADRRRELGRPDDHPGPLNAKAF